MAAFISSTQQGVMSSVISSTHKQGNMPCFFRFLQWIGTFLTHLRNIKLKNIRYLRTLPIDFWVLKILRHLDLTGCIHLTRLPNSFSRLLQLLYLALRNCLFQRIFWEKYPRLNMYSRAVLNWYNCP